MYNTYKPLIVFSLFNAQRVTFLVTKLHSLMYLRRAKDYQHQCHGKQEGSSELFMHAASQASHHNSFRANILKVLTGSLWRNRFSIFLHFWEHAKNRRERWSCLITRFHDFNELITVGRPHKRQSSHRPQRFRMDVTVTTTTARN